MLARKALAGTAGTLKLYVEDVFSTYLYTGTGSSQTITNNIDLSGKGGLVWIKGRSGATGHRFTDTARTATKSLESNSTAAEATESTGLTAFSGTGFTIGADADYNTNTATYASWTFRKAEKFFDVVTYTGNGSNRTISHNLGSVPGSIFIKRTDTTGAWAVYHRSLANTEYLVLNTTAAKATGTTYWNSTTPTSTEFSLGTATDVNANSGTYVAYLFAHDAGGFGDAGDQNVISCGSFTTDGSGNATVNLGYEPQWVLIKASSTTGPWNMFDVMRGMAVGGSGSNNDNILLANSAGAETASYGCDPSSTGFIANGWGVSQTYIYIAIRRGPMKTPTSGTEVFTPFVATSTNATTLGAIQTAFPIDAMILGYKPGSAGYPSFVTRLTQNGAGYIATSSTAAEQAAPNANWKYAGQTGWYPDGGIATDYFGECFRRAPGFFDVVCYTGTGANTTVSHNLGVVPELMIIKRRGSANDWAVYANNDNTDYLVLNTTAATVDDNTYWNDTSPTSSVFSVGTNNATNASGSTYVAYLFASLSGVSKVGSYTGNGSSVTVTTDFQPRFIMVKRTDSTGNWIVGDSARGLVSADEPALFLNSTAAETTGQDWVDVSSTGFTVNETALNANVNTATYIYLAIA